MRIVDGQLRPDGAKPVGLIYARCGVDDCEERFGGTNMKEINRRLDAHRKCVHPDWVAPPQRALEKLPEAPPL